MAPGVGVRVGKVFGCDETVRFATVHVHDPENNIVRDGDRGRLYGYAKHTIETRSPQRCTHWYPFLYVKHVHPGILHVAYSLRVIKSYSYVSSSAPVASLTRFHRSFDLRQRQTMMEGRKRDETRKQTAGKKIYFNTD